MIIDNFHGKGVCALPAETNPILVIDTDAVLSRAVGFQSFQAVSWRDSQVIQTVGLVEHEQLSSGHALEICRNSSRCFIVEKAFGFFASKALYHAKRT